jgi:hypothetical protein
MFGFKKLLVPQLARSIWIPVDAMTEIINNAYTDVI